MDELEVIPEAIAVATQSIVANARRLGLTWTMSLATVVDSATAEAAIILDNDSEPIDAISMIGPVAPTTRVYVIQVPPGGNYIVGTIAGQKNLVGVAIDTTSSAAVTAETVVLTISGAAFAPGLAYSVEWLGEVSGSIVNTAAFTLRRTGVAGTILYNVSAHAMNPTVGVTTSINTRTIVINATPITVTDDVVLTLQSIGGGTVTMAGLATRPRYLEIRHIGAAADYSGAVQI